MVVGAAVLRGDRILAARRAGIADGWEFPGGKVEPGETEPAALVREVEEELGVRVAVLRRLGEEPIGTARLLRVYWCRLGPGHPTAGPASGPGPEPMVGPDHDELRWASAADLAEGAELAPEHWLPADRPLVRLAAQHLLTPDFVPETVANSDG